MNYLIFMVPIYSGKKQGLTSSGKKGDPAPWPATLLPNFNQYTY